MFTLFIDTHFKDVNIVLYKDGKVIDHLTSDNQKHSVVTMPLIVDILKNNNIKINSIKEIICVNGPGSFTGVRIGVTISKVLAYSLGIKVKVIDYLELMSIFSNCEYVAIVDKNGAFIGHFKNQKKLDEYIYLNMPDYINFKNNHMVDENVNIDYEKLYKYMLNVKNTIPHLVKPVYVKNIEAGK